MSEPEAGYPPPPWGLAGELTASVFLVPCRLVTSTLPTGWRPVRLAGRAVVAAAWVDYSPAGELSYRELLTSVLVRRGRQVVAHIDHIWVDSAASRDGGRELWGIPKQLATFEFDDGVFAARDDTGPLARGGASARMTLPRRWPVSFRVVQTRDGRPLVSRVRADARIALSSARFEPAPGSVLSHLAGRRPVLSFALRDFRMRFGV